MQIPGWNIEPDCKLNSSARIDSVRQEIARTETQLKPRESEREFIDAELHEELIWLEAAVVCDEYVDSNACNSRAARHKPGWVLAHDASDQEPILFQARHKSDVDDWYSSDIESEMLKLEQQRYALAEAQVEFEVALQRMRPLFGTNSASTNQNENPD